VAAVLAGVLASVACFVLRTLPVTSDPWHYLHAGLTFPRRSWDLVGLTRYGMVLPEVGLTRLFHASELAYYLPPVLATGVLVGSTYWLTHRFFGHVAAVPACVLLLANSVVLLDANRLYPDIFAAATTTLAVLCAVRGRDAWRDRPRVDGRLWLRLVLTGLAVGLSWWMRETTVFAWPVVALVLLWRGGPPVRAVLPAAGGPALAFLVAEAGVSRWAFGDLWIRERALLRANLATSGNPTDRAYVGQGRLAYLRTVPHGMLGYADGRWMIAMAVVAVLGGLVLPRTVGLFSGWFVLVSGCLLAAGGLLRPGHPSIRLDDDRYWLMFLPPMVIAAVGTVAATARAGAARWPGGRPGRPVRAVLGAVLALALVAGPVLASAQQVRRTPAFVVTNGDVMGRVRTWLHRHDAQVRVVVTDAASARLLPLYTLSFDGQRQLSHVRFVGFRKHLAPGPGQYLVLFSARNDVCVFCRARVDRWLSRPRHRMQDAVEVWHTPDRTVVVYRLPAPGR
jgi:4-amino-4-deoxy-L-arabinose transferase-like glycosyltransferase